LNLLLANAVARKAIGRNEDNQPRLQVLARIGAGPTLPHAETKIDGVLHEGYELGRLAFQASAGVELRFLGPFAMGAEYKFTRTSQSLAIHQGKARGTFATHHVVFGLAWHIE
jgi:opacity protein-like surface antigen